MPDIVAEITDFKSGQDHIEVTFDIEGGIEANSTSEFEKQDNGPTYILINGQLVGQLKAGLEVNEEDIKLIFQAAGKANLFAFHLKRKGL